MRDRIRNLLPGDEFKAQRHALYSKPDFLILNPTDEQILAEIEFILPAEKVAEVRTKAPEIIPADIDPAGLRARADSTVTGLNLASAGKPVIVATAADYQEADKGYAAAKAIKKSLESERKRLKAPVLDLGRYIDGRFNEAEALVDAELARYEAPMLVYKAKERETLRAQEVERQRLEAQAEAERVRLADEARQEAERALEVAKANLEAIEEDPFLAALDLDIPAAREEVKDAMREVILAPRRIEAQPVILPDYVAPVTAAGSRTSYPWRVEVVDEATVAREYCSPDNSKLLALGKYLKATVGDINKVEHGKFTGLRITEQIKLGGR